VTTRAIWPIGRDGSSTRPATRTGERRSGFAGKLRKRFIYLRVEPRYSDQAGGLVSCSWLDDDVVGLPTISSTLRSGDQFPTLGALTRLMEAVATARRRQVRDSLDNPA